MMFDDFKFHPSQLGKLLTESRTKDKWSETAKGHLLECYINVKYGRYKDFSNKYMEKGTMQEQDGIDLYSLVKRRYFEKNNEKISNAFFIGTPDIIEGESIDNADTVTDIKCSWDIFTFYATMHKPLNKDYYWQLQAYMDLTGAKSARLVYCLVNTPYKLIEDEKKKAFWRLGVIDETTDEAYLKVCESIEKNGIYDDIPMEDRYIDFIVERNQADIDKAKQKVIEAREFLNSLNIQK